jgi:hypothetical protein
LRSPFLICGIGFLAGLFRRVANWPPNERLRLPDKPDGEPPSYLFESLDFPVTDRMMESFYAEFPMQSKPSELHQHDGVELIYVMKGQLAVNIGGDDVVLNESDAVYFDSGRRTAIAERAGLRAWR